MSSYDKVLQPIADKLIAELEQYTRTGKYTRPFNSDIPYNVHTDKTYSGVNVFALLARQKSSPVWGTYLQWQKLGYRCTSGTGVAVYSPPLTKKEESEDGVIVTFDRPARAYIVFNGADVVHMESGESYQHEIKNTDTRNAECEAFFAGIPFTLKPGSQASYLPSKDEITMPDFNDFINAEAYYSTLAHELVHWTGHATRLNRGLSSRRDNLTEYAKEELVAELGAVLLSAQLGLPVAEYRTDHYEYLYSWLSALKDDKTYLREAVKYANEAVRYILEIKPVVAIAD